MRRILILSLLGASLSTTPLVNGVYNRLKESMSAAGFESLNPANSPTATPLWVTDLFKNNVQKITVVVHCSQSPNLQGKQRQIQLVDTGGAGGPAPEGSFSGKSLGEHCRSSANAYGFTMQVIGDRYYLKIDVGLDKRGTEAEIEERRGLARSISERVTRQLLADAMAIDLDDSGSQTNTAHITGAETNKVGFATLAAWAHARSVTVSYDASATSASFTRNGKIVKLLLASDKAIVNGREMDLGGKFIMARGSLWFVPAAELDNAIDEG